MQTCVLYLFLSEQLNKKDPSSNAVGAASDRSLHNYTNSCRKRLEFEHSRKAMYLYFYTFSINRQEILSVQAFLPFIPIESTIMQIM